MNGRCFLDTNIFIYSLDRRNPGKAAIAVRLIEDQALDGTGVVSYQVVQEFVNVALKRAPELLEAIAGDMVLTTLFAPMACVQSSHALCLDALRLHRRYQLAWYDSLIVSAASQANCAVLYSEDLQHGQQINGVRVQNPFLNS